MSLGPVQRQILLVFRYDDYSSLSSTDVEAHFLAAFEKQAIPCTLGIVPYISAGDTQTPGASRVIPLTPDKSRLLRSGLQSGLLEIALHGYSHQTVLSKEQGGWTEFRGLNLERQAAKLIQGKQFLEQQLGTRVTTFIPPWNAYDRNTLRALEQTGFRTISAGRTGIAGRSSRLKFLPWTCRLRDVPDALRMALEASDPLPAIVALFHAHDFSAVSEDRGAFSWRDLDEMLAWVNSQKDVKAQTIDQVAQRGGSLSGGQYMDYAHFFSGLRRRLAPPFLKRAMSHYPSAQTIRAMRVKDQLILALIYLGLFAALIIAVRIVLSRLKG